ncbi:BTB/POZ domain and ankyrin repeat-containing protein NPR1-like [Senna tora]|uniref:BTB/POZ domain and ankyrin repeat-containing protein NPR1-like n=1 Tax=Senna tora TaxID=362788 RepID=A0A834SMF3_9FABA|nr:BTB/POZ domain and ankyrin repeat-containing protein NPR1-like [Senna tora]
MDSRIGFSDSNEMSNNNNNSSAICCLESSSPSPSDDVVALRRLSKNLESIFSVDSDDFFADARIVLADGREVPVHRCILSARSPFLKEALGAKKEKLELKELLGRDCCEIGLDAIVGVLGYLYSGKVMRSLPEGVCVCVDDDCSHFGCRPAVNFMAEVLYASSVFQIPELVSLYQDMKAFLTQLDDMRYLLHILDKVAADDILLVLYVANLCGKSCEKLLSKCTEMIVKSDVDVITLEKTLPQHVVKQIIDQRIELGSERLNNVSLPDKHVKRIHRALDSDDVELVQLLLREGHTNLDEAYALHYAVAYCDAKTTTELLDLGLADVNCRNPRGYSVLHVAAMRKEPKIIVSLLTKGAQPSDLTLDGRKALQILKRLTKAVDYYNSTEEGKASSKDRLCIEILEQAERREPILGEASLSLAMAGDDLRMKLLYLENRVGLAKLLFPMEAKVVMDIAQVDGTCEFPLLDINLHVGNNTQRTTVDLNEAPYRIKEEHLIRMRALSRTVELGKRFFPRCSEVLNKIMDADDLSQLACMGDETPEERQVKRRRYMELQEVLSKAFNEDKEEFDKSGVSSSSSSTSIEITRRHSMKN